MDLVLDSTWLHYCHPAKNIWGQNWAKSRIGTNRTKQGTRRRRASCASLSPLVDRDCLPYFLPLSSFLSFWWRVGCSALSCLRRPKLAYRLRPFKRVRRREEVKDIINIVFSNSGRYLSNQVRWPNWRENVNISNCVMPISIYSVTKSKELMIINQDSIYVCT